MVTRIIFRINWRRVVNVAQTATIVSFSISSFLKALPNPKMNTIPIQGVTRGRNFDTIEELLMNLDANICRDLLDGLPKISILDPACGSGAFLVSAMNTLTKIYTAITGKIEYLTNSYLTNWLRQAHAEHDSLSYYIKKKIITDNLFGVDIMEEGNEIARLRLFL